MLATGLDDIMFAGMKQLMGAWSVCGMQLTCPAAARLYRTSYRAGRDECSVSLFPRTVVNRE